MKEDIPGLAFAALRAYGAEGSMRVDASDRGLATDRMSTRGNIN